MLDIKLIRDQEDKVRQGLLARGASLEFLEAVVAEDGVRRKLVTEVENLKNQRNVVSKEIGMLKSKGQDTAATQQSMRELGDLILQKDNEVREIDARLKDNLLRIPNLPHSSLPDGLDASANVVARTHGAARSFTFQPKGHVEVGERLGIFDFARGARMTGSGFPLYLGRGAKLQRALIQFMLDLHTTKHGYTEMLPPFVVNTASMIGTGQLPKMAEDMYHATDDLWLIPTAEVPVTNYYRDDVIDKPLPVYLTAYTPCFRREAGAAGKETRGIIRVHQFDKVEMVKFVEPATSYSELESLVVQAEEVLQLLGLHYRVLSLCKGDISFAAAKCYDIELWAPGQNGWLEVSSCSNFEAFQARRANIRYRRPDGKLDFVHTLNGSGVALPRLMVAILENGQEADGSVTLPEAIVPYMGGIRRLEPVG